MPARAATSVLLLSAALAAISSLPVSAGPWIPAPGEHYSAMQGSVFTADSRYDGAGTRVPLGGSWEERALLSYNELGWKKKTSVVLAAPATSVTDRGGIGATERTSTGLANLQFGLRYALAQGATAAAVQLDWDAPLGYDRNASLLGDGLQQLTASLQLGTAIAKRGFVEAGAGYGYRFLSVTQNGKTEAAKQDWANVVTASADLGLWLTRSVLLGGRYGGTITTSHGDLFAERNLHLAGPVLLYRVDERMDLMAGSWSTAAGKNTLHYDRVYVAVAFKQTRLDRLQGFLGGSRNP
ncbi:MAG: hypothetical protein HZC42_07900 [Candidatus Eisenbacteria bacterium]|nr:hypothetical protein [Candidatus Eisenbacteria bacterium]